MPIAGKVLHLKAGTIAIKSNVGALIIRIGFWGFLIINRV